MLTNGLSVVNQSLFSFVRKKQVEKTVKILSLECYEVNGIT